MSAARVHRRGEGVQQWTGGTDVVAMDKGSLSKKRPSHLSVFWPC